MGLWCGPTLDVWKVSKCASHTNQPTPCGHAMRAFCSHAAGVDEDGLLLGCANKHDW